MPLHMCPSPECAGADHRWPVYASATAVMPARDRAKTIHETQKREWFSIENKADGATGNAVIRIFDEVGFFGTSAAMFAQQLDDLDVKTIDLHLNSPGGEVWDGIAIFNALRQHKARVTTYVDGVAASIASIIALAGDEVVMSQGSEFMIHDAWGLVVGNADDMEDMLTRLNKQSDNLAGIYASKAGGTTEEWRAAMKAETWYSAEEAVEAKLADRVATTTATDNASDSAKARFDLRIFNYAGRAKAPPPAGSVASAAGPDPKEGTMPSTDGGGAVITVNTPAAPTSTAADTTVVHTPPVVVPATAPTGTPAPPDVPAPVPPAATAVGTTHQEGAGMIDPALLRQALGMPESATDEEVRAAVVASGYASFTPFDDGGPKPPKVGRPPATGETPKGVVMVDESILDQLRQDASAGQEAFNRLIRQERDQTIAAAINDGKFAPARREHWEKAWDRDPEGTKAAIRDLSKGLIPTNPKGYTVDPEGKNAETELYAELYPEAVALGYVPDRFGGVR